MKYNRYSKYKDSGIEWIGEIPEGWEVKKLKFVLKNNDGGVWGEFDENGTIVIRSTEINPDGSWNFQNPAKCNLNSEEIRRSLLLEGDLLITKSSGSDLHIGKTALVTKNIMEKHCCFSNFMQRIRLNHMSFPKFFFYFINSVGRTNFNYISTTTTGLQNLNQEKINELIFSLPSLPEAIKISDFLDKQTTQFDELIAKSKAQVTLIEEKRQATITQAVTKGLDPSVPMKDSGVEWIGVIPEGWEILPLFTVCKDNKKKNIGNKLDNVLSLSYGKIKRRNLEKNFGLLPASFETYQILDDGDIVLRLTDLQNDKRSLRVGLVREKGIITSAYTGLKVSNSINSGFLYNLLHFYDLEKIFYGLGSGVRQSMNFSDLKRLPLVIPSTKEESDEITNFLDKQTSQFDELIAKSKAQITLLEEKKQALITATVTGKIDVRSEVVA